MVVLRASTVLLAGVSVSASLDDARSLVDGDVETFVRALKADHEGEIDVAGPELAGHLSALGLIDEYRLYLSPVVLGGGKPFFTKARSPLRFMSSERIGEHTILLRYVPA